ncbi:unnamed protein product [Acanthoscelides obtectus]|uniref:Ubiquitin-like domain-containing protein n=1 Tax=Acanthoscelides obtectus TaxID=200917 RepID=A0A9P0L6E5_ACAOB|nr:unnamed protein product [Acanthoscelides obtectus]CAK1670647.1 Midnolin-B [Acanthoscelides obtectus]
MKNRSHSSNNPIHQGCGSNSQIKIHVSPTTGGDFHLSVEPNTTVENLKKIVSKRLKVPRDRICLLFRDKQLQEGNLVQHGISEGSRITLLPNVETGLIAQRPEIGIMQALESLNDTQVTEFLCGKAPLNLSMRLGDHMMLIQLQLSTAAGAAAAAAVSSSNRPSTSTQHTASASGPSQSIQQQSTSTGVSSSTVTNPPSLLQASRNLQHTLRRLSADVFSGRERGRRESVYSGTFSGALNPALQDPKGRPRRDVATIVHILNDLLCSVPELRRVATTRRSATSTVDESGAHSLRDEQKVGEEMESDIVTNASTSTATPVGGTDSCEDQNSRTRGKLEHLRLVMGERRERRRQRKQKPYSLPQNSDTADTVIA